MAFTVSWTEPDGSRQQQTFRSATEVLPILATEPPGVIVKDEGGQRLTWREVERLAMMENQ